MLRFSTGTRQQLSPQLFEKLGQYRREVFINRLGWELDIVSGMELDEFDGPNAVYVCSYDIDGNVNGVARLLPTTAPYLLKKVFPQLWAEKELPCNQNVWELSRFAAVDLCTNSTHISQSTATHAPNLFRYIIELIRRWGAQQLITVSPIGMERLLKVHGFHASRMGMPKNISNAPIVALRIEVN